MSFAGTEMNSNGGQSESCDTCSIHIFMTGYNEKWSSILGVVCWTENKDKPEWA